MEKKQVVVVRRDTNEKTILKMSELFKIKDILDSIQNDMFTRSDKLLKENIHDASNFKELKNLIKKKGGFIRVNWCENEECERKIKEETNGAEIRGNLYDKKEAVFGNCIYCEKPGKLVVYVAKAY